MIFLVVAFPWPKNKFGSKKFGYCEPETGENWQKPDIIKVTIYKQFVILYVLLFSVFGSDSYIFFLAIIVNFPPKMKSTTFYCSHMTTFDYKNVKKKTCVGELGPKNVFSAF